ncbi:hypothetical protein Ciccas_009420 [Cichlidogyrus casuarinus]|uniref:carbonic anhydrase n=1 Tax=Cichlidogyrus casuarinus TaxID=1844966 RepID=A0ABD2PYH9_9PLAT
MEMHLVHHKSEFGSLAEAINSNVSDALAVLGILFEENARNNSSDLVSSLFKGQIIREGDVTMQPIDLVEILKKYVKLNSFFRYDGSLTTPNCNEVVVWTVISDPLPIAPETASSSFNINLLPQDGRIQKSPSE